MINVICENCGKLFKNYKSNHRRFCSLQCCHEASIGRIPWNKNLQGRRQTTKEKENKSKAMKEYYKNGGINPMKGKHHSIETRKKQSEAQTGRLTSKKHRKNLSLSLMGNKNRLGSKQTEETKEKISKANIGKKRTEETKEKQRQAKLRNPNMYWLGRHRSEKTKKKISQALTGRFCGENSPSWQNGKSFEPYGLEFNKELREVIRNRDRRKCQMCDKTELENGRKLDVHHIDHDKKNNDPKNLISLCYKCHAKIHHGRNYQNYKF